MMTAKDAMRTLLERAKGNMTADELRELSDGLYEGVQVYLENLKQTVENVSFLTSMSLEDEVLGRDGASDVLLTIANHLDTIAGMHLLAGDTECLAGRSAERGAPQPPPPTV